jgi:hypothetical protein
MPVAKIAVARYHTSSPRLRRSASAADATRPEDNGATAMGNPDVSRTPRLPGEADSRATAAAKPSMSRAPRMATDPNSRTTAVAKPRMSRAPRFATGATRRASDSANSGPLLRMILNPDSALLAVRRAADSVQRRVVRAPRFAGGAARRAASRTAYVADSRLSGQRRRTKTATRPMAARTTRPPPTFLALQSELFLPRRPDGMPASDGWRRAQAA